MDIEDDNHDDTGDSGYGMQIYIPPHIQELFNTMKDEKSKIRNKYMNKKKEKKSEDYL